MYVNLLKSSAVIKVHKLEKDMYSTTEEDLETVICIFDFPKMRAIPRKTQKLEIDLLVVAQVVLSELE